MSLVCEPRTAYACCFSRDKDSYAKTETGPTPIPRKSLQACYEHVTRSSEKNRGSFTNVSLSDLDSFRSMKEEQ